MLIEQEKCENRLSTWEIPESRSDRMKSSTRVNLSKIHSVDMNETFNLSWLDFSISAAGGNRGNLQSPHQQNVMNVLTEIACASHYLKTESNKAMSAL